MDLTLLLGMALGVIWTGVGVVFSVGFTDYTVVEGAVARACAYTHCEQVGKRWLATWHPAFRAARRAGRLLRDARRSIFWPALGLTMSLTLVCFWTWPTWAFALHAARTEALRRWVTHNTWMENPD